MPRKSAAAARLAARHDGFAPERQRRFLELLAETGCVAHAALLVGVSRTTIYRLRRDPEAEDFRIGWQEAMAQAIDTLTDIAFDRAVAGVEEPVFYRGEQVGTRVRTSDRLVAWLLSHRALFAPLRIEDDRRTVTAIHDSDSFADALDRIAPAAEAEAALGLPAPAAPAAPARPAPLAADAPAAAAAPFRS